MANINPDCFVKWSVTGGTIAGKVQKIHNTKFTFNGNEVEATEENQVAEILLPGDQIVVAELSALSQITEVDYKGFVQDLAEKLVKDSGACYMNTAEVQAMKDECAAMKARAEAAEAALAATKAEAEAMKVEYASLKASAEKASADAELAKAEIAKMQKEKVAMARFDQATKANFAKIFGDTEDTQKAALAELDEKSWSLAMKMAGRLTDQTVTTQPKLTEQTITDKTKLTDAKASLEDAAVDNKNDPDPAAAVAANVPPVTLATAVSVFYKESKKSKNSKK